MTWLSAGLSFPHDAGADRSGGTRLQMPNVQRPLHPGGEGWAFVAEATLTYLGTPYIIPAGELALCDEGGVTLATSAHYYIIYVLASAPTILRACWQEHWQAAYTAADCIGIGYITEHYSLYLPIFAGPCLPFTGTPDPYVVQVADLAGEVGPIHFGADGNLYAAVPSAGFLAIVRVATDLSGGTTPFLDTTAQSILFFRDINFGGDFASPHMHTDFAVSATKIYVSDALSRVWSYNLDGTGATVVAGTGIAGFNGDGTATACKLQFPTGLALAPDGLSLLICDMGNGMVRRLTFADGQLTRVAGGHKAGHPDQTDFSVDGDIFSNTGDGGLATADGIWVSAPSSVVQAPNGDLYIGLATLTHIKKVDASTGILSTYSPGGFVTEQFSVDSDTILVPSYVGFACPEPGSEGDRYSVALDPLGNVYAWTCGVLSRSNVQVTDIAPHAAGRSSGFGTHISVAGHVTIPDFLVWGADGLLYSTRQTTIVRWQCAPA